MDNKDRAFTQEEQQLIVEIMALAFAVHCNTEFCAFIDFSGHIDSLGIHLTKSQADYNTRILETEFDTAHRKRFTENPERKDNVLWLEAKRDVLREVLKQNSVDVSGVDRISREIFDRVF